MNAAFPSAFPSAEQVSARATEMAKANPASAAPTAAPRRRSMALPTLKLEVPAIPGHVCHWFRGTAQRLQQAIDAGYQYVGRNEVLVNNVGVANTAEGDGNTDLGSRVSVSAGGEDSEGSQGMRLYLMKLRRELWDEDQIAVDARHESIAAQLRGDRGFAESGQDTSNRYTRGEQKTHMFNPKRRSA